jgi:hypothetical protein
MSIPAIILIDGAIVTVVWKLWKSVGRWQLVVCAVLVTLLAFSIWATDTQSPALATPAWLAAVIQFGVYFSIPALAVVVTARLVAGGQPSAGPVDWRLLVLKWLVAVGILLLIGYQIMLGSIWDVATDGLRGLVLLMVVDSTAIAVALYLAWSLPGRWKLAALAFAASVFVLMEDAHKLGTYDADGKWGTLPALITEQRAATIDQALQRYHAQQGSYPERLSDLTPWYLVYLPTPYMIPGHTWCYEGNADSYRFGYLYREYFSSQAALRIHAAVGKTQAGTWDCP